MASERIISVIGLGYVGLTTAVEFSHVYPVLAFDIDAQRIRELKKKHDENNEVSSGALTNQNLYFTHNSNDLKKANFHIISVPTPLYNNNHPNLDMLLAASKTLGAQLKKGDIVVYESSVYPGATEEQCIPVLEAVSQLTCGPDFAVGFSPERINPADKEHHFNNIIKIVSATDKEALTIIGEVYQEVISAGVFYVSSIKTAEATKVIENTQRDVNIALMNDIAMMMHHLGVDTNEVIEAMKTKWNFIPFQPGLVGGHCIGVNTYYLMHKAHELGYHSDLMASARRTNEFIPHFIVLETIKQLIDLNILIKGARIGLLGLTYKENCPDLRDTGVIHIIRGLESYGLEVLVHDPLACPDEAFKRYGIALVESDKLTELDALMLTVAHEHYLHLSSQNIEMMLKPHALLVDLKNTLSTKGLSPSIAVWRL